jgi:hypothetical protein
MIEDGDQLLDLIGGVLVVTLVVMLGIGVLVAANAPALRADPPDADWTIQQVNTTYVRIVQTGGEPVAASSLVVTVDGYKRHASWTGRVTPGDAVAVKASRTQVVRLYWVGGRGDRVQVASRHSPATQLPAERRVRS